MGEEEALQVAFALSQMPAQMEPESNQEPEPEVDHWDEPEQELEPPSGPMVEFDTAAVLAWVGLVPGLTVAQRTAATMIMAEDEYEGAELATVKPKTLRRLLKDSDAEEAVPLLLTARDAQLVIEEAATTAAKSANAASTTATDAIAPATDFAAVPPPTVAAVALVAQCQLACTICLEPYSVADGVVPRILIACGHSFCEVCLDRMLQPLVAKKSRKQLSCPTCRKKCAVKGGRAAELPTVWAILS
jgi:hypothetical protein